MKLPWKKRERELEAEVDRLRANLLNESAQHRVEEQALRNQVEYLIRTIRQTDDIIFSIQQSADGSWKTVQPRFAQLVDQMTHRKVAESNRISDLIRPELIKTYTDPQQKRIGNK